MLSVPNFLASFKALLNKGAISPSTTWLNSEKSNLWPSSSKVEP